MIRNMPSEFKLSPQERLNNAIIDLENKEWYISLPLTDYQLRDYPYRPSHKKEIYTTQFYWQGAFNKQQLIKPVSVFVYSSPQEFIDCLYEHGFLLAKGVNTKDENGNYYYQFILFPNNICIGTLAIPSKYLE